MNTKENRSHPRQAKKLDEITLDAVMRNQIAPDDIKISKKCFMHRDRWQKKTAMIRWEKGIFERAAELVDVPG